MPVPSRQQRRLPLCRSEITFQPAACGPSCPGCRQGLPTGKLGSRLSRGGQQGWADVLGWVVIRGCWLHTCLGERMYLLAVITTLRSRWIFVPSFPASCPPAAGQVPVRLGWGLSGRGRGCRAFLAWVRPLALRASTLLTHALAPSLTHRLPHLPRAACLPLCKALPPGDVTPPTDEAAQTQVGKGGGGREERPMLGH